MFDYGQNVFQWTSNEPLWHYLKLNWLTTLDPLASNLASDAYFQFKWPYFVYFQVQVQFIRFHLITFYNKNR